MNDPYSRVYWSVMDDPKFDGIREDVRVFGAWSLMLVVADMAWPAPAFVPPGITGAVLAKLVACRLIDELPGHRYRVHGLAAEREKRSQSARNAAAVRWRSGRNAEPMLDEDEAETRTRRDEIDTPPPPTSGGMRSNGTNPRATRSAPRDTGANQRATGKSVRQIRQARKTGPSAIGDVLRRAAAAGRGQITEAQRMDMDDRDADLGELEAVRS
jgi:hypothetical protein